MEFRIFTQAAKFLREQKRNKRLMAIFVCLAVAVALTTVGALRFIGHALTHKEKILVCQLSVHQHAEECYDEAQNLLCGYADYVVHVHNDDCYDSQGNLACTLQEIPEHTHTEECYTEQEVLICDLEESDGHVHTDECYMQQAAGLQCLEAEHIHTSDSCYDEEGSLVCSQAEHQHDGSCYDENGNLICGQQAHTHKESCYDEENNLVCESAEHQHNEGCIAWENSLVCELEEGEDGHSHSDECYEVQKTLACGQLELHTHTEECYEKIEGEEESYYLICGMIQLEEHVHSEESGCFEIVENLPEADFITTTTEAPGPPEETEQTEETDTKEPEVKTYEDTGYVVTAEYGKEANIPEEAELIAEMITPESDEAHYAEREAEFKEHAGDENAVMSALLKVGFYVDGVEVEPEAAVKVSIQLLDENGLPEGTPITVVHFGEDGTEKLEGSEAKNNRTTFEIDGFSEIAIGYDPGKEVISIPVAESYEYQSDHFHMMLYIEGNATLPKNEFSDEEAEQLRTAGTEADGEESAKLELTVTELGEDSPEYELISANTFFLNTFAYSFSYNGIEADLSKCTIMAEVTPGEAAEAHAKEVAFEEESQGLEPTKLAVKVYEISKELQKNEIGRVLLEETEEEKTAACVVKEPTVAVCGGKAEEEAVEEGKTLSISDSYEYRTDAFHITFHVEGEAVVQEEKAEENSTEDLENGDNVSSTENIGDTLDTESKEDTLVPESVEEESNTETDNTGDVSPSTESEEGTEGEISQPAVENDDTPAADESVNDTVQIQQSPTIPGLEFAFQELSEESENYKAAADYAEENGNGGELFLVRAFSYSMSYGGADVDLSDCKVTAEFTPTKKLGKYAKEAVFDDEEENGEDQTGLEMDVTVVQLLSNQQFNQVATAMFDETNSNEIMTANISTEPDSTVAVYAEGTPNPHFTVQYYANLNVVAHDDNSLKKNVGSTTYTNELPVIDTTGGKLPQNGKGTSDSPNDNEIRKVYVDQSTGKLTTKAQLTEVYSSRSFEYHKAPTINYINALIENFNYSLKEVWVLKDGKEPSSIKEDDWNSFSYKSDVHFTNRWPRKSSNQEEGFVINEDTEIGVTVKDGTITYTKTETGYEMQEGGKEPRTYIVISEDAILRLVYDTTDKDKDFKATFYDYDIGNGKIYSSQTDAANKTSGKNTSTQGTGTWWMHTKQSGINSSGNYSGSGAKFAFGNTNTGSGLQFELWGSNLLNKYNGTQDGYPKVTGTYQGCTFGMADSLNADGTIKYAGGLNVPKLFNETGTVTGKSTYTNYSLKFNRVGDTYTLTAVNGAGANANNLDTFNHPSPYSGKVHNHIWTNNFWPMDSASSYGTNGHDMKFGSYANRAKYNFSGQKGDQSKLASSTATNNAKANSQFPYSDDGKDHNSNFGMHYEVEFDLVADYVGPLEYYFFGDDDMWVFLDGELVCDIGGVHSSVGEYVNLWDYLGEKDKNGETIKKVDSGKAGEHKLSFFYTERGESGSSCWMQFTLPSVSSLTPETTDEDYGHLRIEKTVTEINNDKETMVDNNDEFTFEVRFTDAEGNRLADDYSYVKYWHTEDCYDKDGKLTCKYQSDKELGSELIIWDGGNFTLKNDEYIIVKFLPPGTQYCITETNKALTITKDESDESKSNKETSRVTYYTDISFNDEPPAENKTDLEYGKVAEGNVSKGDMVKVKYNNKYYVYELPETGGPGTILYTIAGAITLLFGAGFMYRKKFRERRV